MNNLFLRIREKSNQLERLLKQGGPFWATGGKFRNKLLVSFVLLALIPLVMLGLISYFATLNALENKAFSELESIRTLKANEIQLYFDNLRANMSELAETVTILNQEAFQNFSTINELKRAGLQRIFKQWEDDILDVSSNAGIVTGMRDLAAGFKDLGSTQARLLYLGKTTLGNAGDGSDYSAAHAQQQNFFLDYTNIHGYRDAFLIDLDGNIVYSTQKGDSFGNNLAEAPYQDSSLAELYRQLRDAPAGQTYIADILLFEGEWGMFIGAPIYNRDTRVGTLAFRLSFDEINEIVQARQGLGDTAESYLVGQYRNFRSYRSDRVVKSGQIGEYRISDYSVQNALLGRSGQEFKVGSTGVFELSNYDPLEIPNLNWGIISTAALAEVVAPDLAGTSEDFYTQLVRQAGYADLYLIDPQGFIFYSVNQGPEFQTNILTGPYKESVLAEEVAETLEEKRFHLSDFKPYPPAQDAISAFAIQPVLTAEGEVPVLVAIRILPDQLNAITQRHASRNETEETYLVGPDNLFRNDSRFLEQLGVNSTILNTDFRVDTVAASNALAGETNTGIINNYQGISVLSAWQPLAIQAPSQADPEGITWALVAEIDEAEVTQPVVRLGFILGGLALAAIMVVVLFAFVLSGTLVKQIDNIRSLFGAIETGNLEARAEVLTNDELGEMTGNLNDMLDDLSSLIQTREERDHIQTSIRRLLEEVSTVAEGDLTVEAEVTADITGAIADSFNYMIAQLRRIISNVQDTTLQVSASANEIQTTAEHLSHGSETQSSQIINTSTALDDMAISIQQVSENATLSATIAEQALLNAKKGTVVVQNTIEGMNRLRHQVQETARRMARLGESSQQIGDIVRLINDIADRTSLLALNASIEAALAGEAGQGFAVVAEEVDRLAERSTKATQQIAGLVKAIQNETAEVVAAMETSTNDAAIGSELADQAGQALAEIEHVSTQLAQLIQTISHASKQQARGSEAIARSMNEIAEITHQTAAGTKQAAISIHNLASLADDLRASVSAFKLPNGNGRGSSPY
jgi:methyl-accepting chemotaxis protein